MVYYFFLIDIQIQFMKIAKLNLQQIIKQLLNEHKIARSKIKRFFNYSK